MLVPCLVDLKLDHTSHRALLLTMFTVHLFHPVPNLDQQTILTRTERHAKHWRLLGRVTPFRLWLESLPNVKCVRVCGKYLVVVAPSIQVTPSNAISFSKTWNPWTVRHAHRDLLEHTYKRVMHACSQCLAPAMLCAGWAVSCRDTAWVVQLCSEVVLKPFDTLRDQCRNLPASTCILHHSGILLKGQSSLSHCLSSCSHQHHWHQSSSGPWTGLCRHLYKWIWNLIWVSKVRYDMTCLTTSL